MEKKYNPMKWEAQSMAGGLKKSQHSILRSDKEDLAMDQKKPQIAQKQNPDKIETECWNQPKEQKLANKFKISQILRELYRDLNTGSRYSVDPSELIPKNKNIELIVDITKEKEVNPVKRVKPEIHTVTSDNLSKAPKTLWRRV